ncbi:MAG: acetolactate synthase small subunit [bacterium]|nr:acetolactate synthase small subunit [bacterium]
MKHTISVMVRNQSGVLARIAGLFSARGYNIDSLCVAQTHDPEFSCMTIVSEGDEKILEQITKQLNKLIDVLKVNDFREQECIIRELALVKVNSTATTRSEIMQLVDIFRAKIIDVSLKTLTIELTGPEAKIKAMIELLRPFGIKEIVQTGRVAMARK